MPDMAGFAKIQENVLEVEPPSAKEASEYYKVNCKGVTDDVLTTWVSHTGTLFPDDVLFLSPSFVHSLFFMCLLQTSLNSKKQSLTLKTWI